MKHLMTPRGRRALQDELQKLKGMRPELANAIETARGHGDLSENGDYDAAKNKSGMVEAKIRDIESKLTMAEVVDPSKFQNPDRVTFGVSLKIEEVNSGDQKVLTIVGADESDVARGWINYESPLARAFMGKEAGETVRAQLPGGVKEYEIIEIFVDYAD